MSSLLEMVDRVLADATTVDPTLRSQLEGARARLTADIAIAVAGRRGAGKTTLINRLIGIEAAGACFSAEDHSVRCVTSRQSAEPGWGLTTRLASPYLQGRCLIEVPAHDGAADGDVPTLPGRPPDLLVYVTHQDPRIDERDFMDHALRRWGLASLDVVVVVVDPVTDAYAVESAKRLVELRGRLLSRRDRRFAQVVVVTGSVATLHDALGAVERFVVARRCADVILVAEEFAARSDDRAWSGRLVDDLERLTLTPEAHVLRERWALEESLSSGTRVPAELVDHLVALTLPPGPEDEERTAAVVPRIARWRAEGNRLPPRASEVARVVLRSAQLRPIAVPLPSKEAHHADA